MKVNIMWNFRSQKSPDTEPIDPKVARLRGTLNASDFENARDFEQALMSKYREESLRKARLAGKWLGPTTWVIPALDSPPQPIVHSERYYPSRIDLSPAEFRAALNLGVYSTEALCDAGELEGRSLENEPPEGEDTVDAKYTLIKKLAAVTREFKLAGPDESLNAR